MGKKEITLSALILTKNAQHDIADCITSVSFADEVLVIDSNSTDDTAAVAKKQGAHVYTNTLADFASQREYASSKANGAWILYVDSDERVTKQLAKEIQAVITRPVDSHPVAYRLRRENYYLGTHKWPGHEMLERLFYKDALQGWQGKIHESAIVDGTIGDVSGVLEHYTHADLSSMLAKTHEWSDIESDMILASGHPKMVAWRFVRIMATKFYESYIRQGGWKVGTAGLIESIFQAYSYFVIYAKVWEKQQKEQ